MAQQKVLAFDAQTTDGTSAVLKGHRGGEVNVAFEKGSTLGGGAVSVEYSLKADGSDDWAVAGSIVDLAINPSVNIQIPYESAVRLVLSGATGANLTAWISTIF